MNILGSTKNKITKDKNGENLPHLEITEIVLAHWNIVSNDNQQDSRVSYTFVPNKQFGSLKTFNSKFSNIEAWFTDQNSQTIEIEDRISLTLVIK